MVNQFGADAASEMEAFLVGCLVCFVCLCGVIVLFRGGPPARSATFTEHFVTREIHTFNPPFAVKHRDDAN